MKFKINNDFEMAQKIILGNSVGFEISKQIQQHFLKLDFSNKPDFEALVSRLESLSKFEIPQTTLDAFSSINQQHNQLFNKLIAISETLKIQPQVLAQIKNLNIALKGISQQIVAISVSQKKWDLIDGFEEITEEAVSLNESIFDENGVTKEGLIELKEFLQRIEIKVDKIDADANNPFRKLLNILCIIITLMGEGRNWLPKPEYATKQDVETVVKEQFYIYEKKLKEDNEFRITSRVCNVMSKPRINSLLIEKLPKDFEVTVLHVNHKWVLASYIDPKDNLPMTGWVMKKYLDKP